MFRGIVCAPSFKHLYLALSEPMGSDGDRRRRTLLIAPFPEVNRSVCGKALSEPRQRHSWFELGYSERICPHFGLFAPVSPNLVTRCQRIRPSGKEAPLGFRRSPHPAINLHQRARAAPFNGSENRHVERLGIA